MPETVIDHFQIIEVHHDVGADGISISLIIQ